MSKLSRLVSTISTSVAMMLAVAVPTFAATQPVSNGAGGGNGIKIAPVRSNLTINAGTSQSVTVNVQNITAETATFQAVVNDFVAGKGENGQPALLLDDNQFAASHSLKRFVGPIANVTVAAGQTKSVKVTVTVPAGAAGGGYFGAVRFAPVGVSTPGQTGATLSASVGSLILVKVPGDIKDDLRIASFDVRTSGTAASGSSFFVSGKGLNATIRFNNQGNIQEEPFGKVVLKKGSKVLQTTEINNTDPRGNVLPASIRRFNVSLHGIGTWGKYTVEGNFGYATSGQLLSAKSTFFVVPVALIIVATVLVLLLVAAIIIVPRSIKRYNKRILRRAGRR